LEDFKIERLGSTLSSIIKLENLTFSQSFDIPIVSFFEIPKSFLILAVANRDGLERCEYLVFIGMVYSTANN
jgi:hypothetical protein